MTTLSLRAVGGVSTPSHWTITGPVSLDLQPSSSGHQGLTDLQPSSTGAASLPSLDLPPPPSVSVELGSTQLEFEFESMSPRLVQ